MKLWKNNLSQKSNSINQSNNNMKRLSVKSIELNKYNPISRKSKGSTIKSNDSIIRLINNNNIKNLSFYSSSEEEKSVAKIENVNGMAKTENFFRNSENKSHNLLITTYPTVFDTKTKSKKRNNIKSIYPKIQTKENPILKSVSSFGINRYKKSQFKVKKTFTPIQPTNTILNKWREDFHNIFLKTIKRAKADFSNTFQRCIRNKNKLKIKFENKLKKIKIKNKVSKEFKDNNKNDIINNNTVNNLNGNVISVTINENNINESIENNGINNNEISSERKKNNATKGFQIETSSIPSSPVKTNKFSISPKRKFIISTEQYSGSSFC